MDTLPRQTIQIFSNRPAAQSRRGAAMTLNWVIPSRADGCVSGFFQAARARRRRSMRASWKPTARAAASTVAPWPIR
jgi:hypothetical protein